MRDTSKDIFNDYIELSEKYDIEKKKCRDTMYKLTLTQRQLATAEIQLQKKDEVIANKDAIIVEKDSEINEKDITISALTRKVEKLESLLGRDGTNSNIPTSKTPIDKNKVIPNTRPKTDKKRGGQVGHKKHKLEHFKDEEVTETIEHEMCNCPYCNSEKIADTGETTDKDELDFKIIVTKGRHKFHHYICQECGHEFHAKIPANLKEDNQYGPQVQALELTLMNQGNVTMNKAKSITYGMTNGEINLSEGYIAKLQKRASIALQQFKEDLRNEILAQSLLHWDDTVIMINTKRACLRFYGTEKLGLYYAHLHKNKEGLDEDNILNLLPKDATVVHDHNIVNYNDQYVFTNAECNRHLISDLKKDVDNLKHEWASELIELLTTTNNERDVLIEKGEEHFSQEYLREFNDKFLNIMTKAYQENEKDKAHSYSSTEHTLIVRILDFKEQYLLWVYDFNVPFTNNLSERGVRDAKSKMKASGQFWNEDSAKWYADIKSYIETCKKNDVNVYVALLKLASGTPYTLDEILNHKTEL